MMETSRQVCVYCEREGRAAPEEVPVQSQAPIRRPLDWALIASICFPCVGVVLFVAYVFDPERRARAGLYLAGALASAFIGWVVLLMISSAQH
jgi:hypothetical protein